MSSEWLKPHRLQLPFWPSVLASPLRGDDWLAFNGCCPPTSRHREIRIAVAGSHLGKTETFAIDWIQLRDGRLYTGNGARNAQWFAFGADVLAVAAGRVVSVRDGMPEETPNQPVQHVTQPGDYGGNQVTLALAPGVFAFYAHLQPGSITVKVGDRVTVGQVLGKLGNTGNSTAPHLHFGVIAAPDPFTANSLPMVFAHDTLVGTVGLDAALAALTASLEPAETSSSAPAAASPEPTGPALVPEDTPEDQTATLPLDLAVVSFS